ncbi:ABC transporter permease [Kribbella solani]|uniref:Peptide/nickel transport system permease protein n=1 Tax=Kribbella solani TaxID=236067 RepID=A0A841DP62_9ACTN|nr:ABC transporter permease [Kribbella solani]MBB5980894.1 peptide/nickel transport system permease protein [Kribbella solani]
MTSFKKHALRAFALSVSSIFGASILCFVITRVVPGDPARQALGQFASPEQISQFRADNGLDQSLVSQYCTFMVHFVRGDWGFSYSSGAPVRDLITTALPATIELALSAFAFAVLAGLALALLSTYERRRWVDRIVNGIASFGLGAPPFWVALLVLLVFSERIPILPGVEGQVGPRFDIPRRSGFMTIDTLLAADPAAFLSALAHLVLPTFALGIAMLGYLLRVMRVSLIEVSQAAYILSAQAKGLSRWTAFTRHALHNSLLPVLTASGMVLGQLLAGSVLVEAAFQWPGVGNLVVRSISQQDFHLVDVYVLISATAFVLINLVVDVLHAWIDPRILTSEGAR